MESNKIIYRLKEDYFLKFLLFILFGIYPFSRALSLISPHFEHVIPSITICIILYSIINTKIIKGLPKNYYLAGAIFLFISSTFIGSLFARDISSSLDTWARISLYLVFCYVLSSYLFKRKTIYFLLMILVFSYSVLCALSLLDYFSYLEIPGFNEGTFELFGDGEVAIRDISGPYHTRSQFSGNLAIILPLPLGFVIVSKNKLIWGVFSLIVLLTTLVTFSRGIYVSLTFSLFYLVVMGIVSVKQLCKTVLIIFIISLTLFSEQVVNIIALGYDLIFERFYSIGEGHAGDTWRIDAFVITLFDLRSYPLGMGFNKIWAPNYGEWLNPHNILTNYLRGGGVVGLLSMVTIYLRSMTFKRKTDTIIIILSSGVFSLLVYGLTHEITGSVILWSFVGILHSLKANPIYE